MIAFLCNNRKSGLSIIQTDMPAARIQSSSMRVFLNPSSNTQSGIIASCESHLRGFELSGFVLLTEDIPPRLLEAAYILTRKPFYWHVREQRKAEARQMSEWQGIDSAPDASRSEGGA